MLRIKLTPIYITVSLSKGELSRTLGIPRILSNPETSHFGQRESLEFSVSQPKSPQLLLTKFSQASLDQPSARGSSSSKTLCKSDGKSSVTCTYWPWWLKKPTRCRCRKFRGHHWQSSWKVLALLYFPSETVGWPRWAVCALDGDKNNIKTAFLARFSYTWGHPSSKLWVHANATCYAFGPSSHFYKVLL